MFSTRRLLLAASVHGLCGLAGIVGWDAARAQPSAGDPALRQELESTYQQVRKALKSKDYEGFVALYEHPAGQPLAQAQWAEASEALTRMLPDASKMRFVRVIAADDWAGYFFQQLDNDPNFVTVSLFRFHRAGQSWKFNGAAQSSSFRKKETQAQDDAEIGRWIESKKDIKPTRR